MSGFDLFGKQIKNVQHIEFSLDTSQLSTTLNIDTVDVNKSIILISEGLSSNSTKARTMTEAIFANTVNGLSSQISVSRYESGTPNTDIVVQIIEFENIKSLQFGRVTLPVNGKTVQTVPLTKINLNKTFVVGNTKTNATAGIFNVFALSSEYLTIKAQASSSTAIVNYFVVEFD